MCHPGFWMNFIVILEPFLRSGRRIWFCLYVGIWRKSKAKALTTTTQRVWQPKVYFFWWEEAAGSVSAGFAVTRERDHDDLDEKQQVLQNNYSLGVTLGVHLCVIGAFESFSCHPRADLRRGTLAFYCLCEQSAAVLRWVIVLRQRSKMH